ncbi:MAG: hypothetical protein Tp1100MES1331091_53 [Prokaryotic dsDNA virus sp.]|nr:MAG: hypothetical protein Tp1100MES1331091_53 [Prokaryotic dsDNA virus sp.]|tara:strand:+ start:1342 stop:1578 length:237 start_codon:yes stop_codon:yes gene_type:complete
MDILLSPLVVSLIALVVVFVELLIHRFKKVEVADELDRVAKFIYDLDDPDVLTELSILTDVRRLLLHMELTEGRQRLG